MATKKSAKPSARKRARGSKPRASAAPKATSFAIPKQPDFSDLSKMALDIINTAIENTAKLRKHQFAGEEEARSMQKKALRHAAEASDPQALMAASQSVTQEAVEKSMRYWGEMFDMIVEMQKRLFALMEEQMEGVPGAKEAKAAMAMMPDLRQAQNVVKAMQGVMSSGAPAFESMQRVIGDFTRMAQLPGLKR